MQCNGEAGTAECWILMILFHCDEMFFIKREEIENQNVKPRHSASSIGVDK
jgi:hypothetical protein